MVADTSPVHPGRSSGQRSALRRLRRAAGSYNLRFMRLRDSSRVNRLDPAERFAWLQLARSPGIGPKSHARLIERFGSARAAVAALPRLLATGRWPGVELAQRDLVEAELAAAAALGVRLLLLGEPDYPRHLEQLADAPPVLVVRGAVELLSVPSVAVVGARNASAHGKIFASQLARELSAAGLVVVSGLARGIDTAAHNGALDGPGSTVAVLASGLDRPYPEENAELAERIAAEGCLVSERPLGSEPQARHFPRRNRIIAGLTLGVVVVEAAIRSGSLITASLALELGREVMAVPGSPLDPRHGGTNRLLREGAHLVESAADVLAVLGMGGPSTPRGRVPSAGPPEPSKGVRKTAPPRPARGAPAPSRPTPCERADRIEGAAERILENLGVEPVAIDDLVRQCQITAAVIQDALLELELEGLVERLPGNRVARRAR